MPTSRTSAARSSGTRVLLATFRPCSVSATALRSRMKSPPQVPRGPVEPGLGTRAAPAAAVVAQRPSMATTTAVGTAWHALLLEDRLRGRWGDLPGRRGRSCRHSPGGHADGLDPRTGGLPTRCHAGHPGHDPAADDPDHGHRAARHPAHDTPYGCD